MDINVEMVPLEDLHPDALNPRRISAAERAKLRRSIREFGMVQPVVARRTDHTIIGGHQRYQAARDEGWAQVPVIWWDGPDKQARALNLALNRITGEWDEGKLAEVLADLADVGSLSDALLGFETDLTSLAGFDPKDVLRTLEALESSGAGEEDLSALASALLDGRQAPIASLGDMFALGPHRLICGDSRDRAVLARLTTQVRPDLLFTDPPYGVAYVAEPTGKRAASSGRGSGRHRRPLGPIAEDDLNPEQHSAFITDLSKAAAELLRPGAPIYLCGGTSTTSIYDAAFLNAGFAKSSIIVWDKGSFSFGRKDYQSQYELIYYGWLRGAEHPFMGGRAQSDIWLIPRDPSQHYIHPTQKPVALAQRAIRNSSRAGDAVLDLCGGSGSTLIACEQEARRALIVELDPRYADAIVARWESFTGKKAQLIRESSSA